MEDSEVNENNVNDVQITNGIVPETTATIKRRRTVILTEYSLPDKSSSVDLHLKIIKAYVIATNDGKKAVSYKDFKDCVDFYYGSVSSNNKFLEELGLIESTAHGMYIPTKDAIDFQRYKKWGQEDKALDILREKVKSSWFWQSAKKVLMMREEGADEREILNKIGADSKADPERHISSLKVLIRYLEYVGLIKRDEKTSKIKMALELVPTNSFPAEPLTDEKNPQKNNDVQINGAIEIQPQIIQQKPTESIHYREEPGHFTLRVKLDDTSILLLEEEIKYIKGKYALLQKLKKADDEIKQIL